MRIEGEEITHSFIKGVQEMQFMVKLGRSTWIAFSFHLSYISLYILNLYHATFDEEDKSFHSQWITQRTQYMISLQKLKIKLTVMWKIFIRQNI